MENNIWQSAAIIILTEFYVLWNARLKHQQSVALVNWLTGKNLSYDQFLRVFYYFCFSMVEKKTLHTFHALLIKQPESTWLSLKCVTFRHSISIYCCLFKIVARCFR